MSVGCDVSVCIVSWNTAELLSDCLESIYRGTHLENYEIIVVDNASDDCSASMIEAEHPDVILLKNSCNLGFAKANNQAMSVCSGRYVLLLNSDTVIREGAIDGMVEFMENTPRAGACGPKLLYADGTWQTSYGTFPSIYTDFVNQIRFNFYPFSKALPNRPASVDRYLGKRGVIPVDSLSGACMMVRREVVKQIGGLEERFFLFSEEFDWCLRMMKAGWERYYVPNVEVVHLVGQSRKRDENPRAGELYRSKMIYYCKHKDATYARVVMLMNAAFFVWRILSDVMLMVIKSVIGRDGRQHQKDMRQCLRTISAMWEAVRDCATAFQDDL